MSKQVNIEAVSGPLAGRRIELRQGGEIVVGRLPECDLSDPDDHSLSRKHCRFEYRPPDCVLVNLSTNGTLVNGAPADQVRLRSGDEVTCSQTTLRVTFVESHTRTAAADGTVPARPGGKQRWTCRAEPCRSGLVRYAGTRERPAPLEMLELLSQSLPVYAIIHFQKIGLPIPDDLRRDYLFFWLPEVAAASASPLIVAPADLPEYAAVVEEGWGKDGIAHFATRLDRSALVDHLRAATDYREGARGFLGYCWPELLNTILTYHAPDAAARVMQGIDAVLVESDEAPGGWHLYGDAGLADLLERAGLECTGDKATSEPAAK